MDELAAYLPQDCARALALGGELPELCHGAALFADLSGFTPLTEALDRTLGPRRGTEAMTEQINRVFATLITEVERFGGSVLGFAGDAITGWFDDSSGSAPTSAATCALALQEAMGPFAAIPLPGGASATLSLKVALASGSARRLVVGDPLIQLLDVVAGATLDRLIVCRANVTHRTRKRRARKATERSTSRTTTATCGRPRPSTRRQRGEPCWQDAGRSSR